MSRPATPSELATAYRVAGRGQRVVLVHGLGEDHRSWRPQQLALRDACETVACDLRGHGLTPLGDADGTLAQLGGDLVALIERLGAPCTLVGFSLGGMVALWTAAHRPELVRRLVLLGTSAVVGRRAAAAYRELAALVCAGDRDALVRELRDGVVQGAHRDDLDVERIAARELDAIGDGAGYANAALALARLADEPLTDALGAVRCPTLVASGAFDALCPAAAQEDLLARLPTARYVQIPAAGHLLGADAPALVTATIEDALRSPAPDAAAVPGG